jgi:rhodanese-related sulfurtransferase
MSRKNYQDISFEDFQRIRNQPGAVVVDVREKWEFEEFNEGGLNIPLSEIRAQRSAIESYASILVICTNGVRSRVAAMDYCRVPEWADKDIYHVKGGILEME